MSRESLVLYVYRSTSLVGFLSVNVSCAMLVEWTIDDNALGWVSRMVCLVTVYGAHFGVMWIGVV